MEIKIDPCSFRAGEENAIRLLRSIKQERRGCFAFAGKQRQTPAVQQNADQNLIVSFRKTVFPHIEKTGISTAFTPVDPDDCVFSVNHDVGFEGFIRSTRSYQKFVKRIFNVEILENTIDFNNAPTEYGLPFITAVRQCCTSGNNSFFDEILPNGSVIRSFVRRISVNPITGGVAVAVAVLSISEPSDSTTYADIARALAADYYNIYVIDLDTDQYTEYSSRIGGEELTVERYGEDFFNSAKRDTLIWIFEEDREQFLKLFTRENVLHDLDKQGVFTTPARIHHP